MLELRSITKRFRSGPELVTAVDGASLTVAPGELIALYGPSGSGKTTVLSIAAGIVRPNAGTVLFQGRDIGAFSERESVRYRRSELGFVWQSFQLQPGLSALDNAATKLLAEGMKMRAARARALGYLDLVGLAARADHLPGELSTGERQRVSIARALANEPRLVLADEPTGNLDTRRGAQILDVLAQACADRDVAVLLVTHDERAAAYASRVLALRDGHIEDGAADHASQLRSADMIGG
ncbi:ABC transporter ATP-binding protein [Conexibacter sp. CPCC 206217]|uniref:ABC transporter ATP-binding protein n=1 Tax=Conexibacter sp. CPCC 206217 TaxID=3064574 RepID=UPI00271E9375|nr:ABC transporter ATP-binding protein [Conexibacter sp. CPCC 206217]MDO8209656.1 ABC transporter ATP-binding protein [Conexibacter sp. CPCC 206217]